MPNVINTYIHTIHGYKLSEKFFFDYLITQLITQLLVHQYSKGSEITLMKSLDTLHRNHNIWQSYNKIISK